MRSPLKVLLPFLTFIFLTGFLIVEIQPFQEQLPPANPQKELKKEEKKHARDQYFKRMLQDPETGQIPAGIRFRELDYAKSLPRKARLKKSFASNNPENLDWEELGPNNVGGRTRGLAVDVDNPDIIIAGGVSGGIWKSTDGGANWNFQSKTDDHLSITWIIQDTTSPGNDTWFYATGEFDGNSASSNTAFFHGTGIYKSTDNGDSWTRLGSSEDVDVSFNSPFDYVSRLAINPVTGSLFMSSNIGGIYKIDKNTGSSGAGPVVGNFSSHQYPDITINENGLMLAVLSEARYGGTSDSIPGVYVSNDDGTTWANVTPPTFPSVHQRSFSLFTPSHPDTAYILTHTGEAETISGGTQDEVEFHMLVFDSSGDTVFTEDRTDNLPAFEPPVGDIAQSNYNLIMSVKPDDPEFVLIGFTNIYRSRDAFKTAATNKEDVWIGGYATENNVSQYSDHHPDQHSMVFDPNEPGRFWSGHDGGLSLTSDITVSGAVDWVSMNNGYNVTQFYDISIPPDAGDPRIAGGTQDNGTPFFFSDGTGESVGDASTGDGAYSYFGDNYIYTSTQNGAIQRFLYGPEGVSSRITGPPYEFAFVYPDAASGQLFINPFAVDPNEETTIYYPGGLSLWRNTDIEDPNPDADFFLDGWEELTSLSPSSGRITSIAVSHNNPAHRLYYGVYESGIEPVIYRIDDANTAANDAGNLQDISPGGDPGSYIASIALNPEDANEVIAVMSNYNIVGLYHSKDGGMNWTAIEGNLEGDGSNPGPSLRDAAIIPLKEDTLYMVATSTGVYSTKTLQGAGTVWEQEGPNTIGNVVVSSIAHRISDSTIVAGTHGRGAFGKIPEAQVQENNPPIVTAILDTAELNEDFGSLTMATLDTVFSDPEGQALSYQILDVDDVITAELKLDTLIIHSVSNANGEARLVIEASDEELAVARDTLNVLVNPVNDLPEIVQLPDTISFRNDESQSFSYINSFSDVEDPVDSLTIEISVEPDGIELVTDPEEFEISLSAADFEGEGVLTFLVTDSEGGELEASVILEIETSTGAEEEVIPDEYTLKQNYPNPFNPETRITFALPEKSKVELIVFNLAGQKVATLVDGEKAAGTHRVNFDASGLASGVYIYSIKAGSFIRSRKMTLIK